MPTDPTTRPVRRHVFLTCAAVSILVAGPACNSHSPPKGPNVAKAFPVGGTVKFTDGSPLVGGQVSFSPVQMEVGSKIRYEGVGLVDEKGRYRIGLNGDASGVPAGEYKVTVEPREYKELPKSTSAKIPAVYREATSTPLTLTVKDGENTFDIVLK